MRLSRHFATSAVLFLVVSAALVGCTTNSPTSSPTPTPTAPPAIAAPLDISAHVLAQEGLAIALASNVLQSQLLLVEGSYATAATACVALPQDGSDQFTEIQSR